MNFLAKVIQLILAPVFYLGFRFGLIKQPPRIQHYMFAHKLLPRTFFEHPEEVTTALVSTVADRTKLEGIDMLRALWSDCDVEAKAGKTVDWDPSNYFVTCLSHPNNMVIVISLPEPLYKSEAYYAVMVVDSPGMAAGKIRQLRYFVLEHLGTKGGRPKTYLSEWVHKGSDELEYQIHAEDIPPSVPELLAKIETLLPAKLQV